MSVLIDYVNWSDNPQAIHRSFKGSFLIRNERPTNKRMNLLRTSTDEFIQLEYIIIKKDEENPDRFQAQFDYNNKRYQLMEQWVNHLEDSEIPLSPLSIKTINKPEKTFPYQDGDW